MSALIALSLAVGALALRDVGAFSFLVPVAGGVAAVAVTPTPIQSERRTWLAATALGCAAFALVRFALPTQPLHATTLALLASVAAAVGEELLFRRGVYGLLERFGPALAATGAAVAFGLVHVPMYGWRAGIVDVGAGLVFGWQRFVTGSWTASAATHALANVIGSVS